MQNNWGEKCFGFISFVVLMAATTWDILTTSKDEWLNIKLANVLDIQQQDFR